MFYSRRVGIYLPSCVFILIGTAFFCAFNNLSKELTLHSNQKQSACNQTSGNDVDDSKYRDDCKLLSTVTTYYPCFPSKLLSSKVACHDSYSCKERLSSVITKANDNLPRRAFFSAVYTNNFIPGALLLGYTLRKHHPKHSIYLMHFEDSLSEEALCELRQVGWTLKVVKRIPPPFKGTWPHFIDQFTKLILWNMTEFDSIVYLDADTLVLDDISNLHELVADPHRTNFEFAAVADNWHGKFAYHFNAGMLVLHPSKAVFNELIKTMGLQGNYDPTMAEQAFLNAFFQLRYLQLPLVYNVNLALYSKYPDLWQNMQDDFKVVHFTLVKPFLNQSDSKYRFPLKLYYRITKEYTDKNRNNRANIKCGHGSSFSFFE